MKTPLIILALLLCVGCDARSPRDDYNDFVSRTASAREGQCQESEAQSGELADISGLWVIRALLNGGITLGLRVELIPEADEMGVPPRRFVANFWLENQPLDIDPILTTRTEVDESGAFELEASPLNLGPDVLSSETTVVASVLLQAVVVNGNSFCGVAQGMATSPLELDLSGSSFSAVRHTESLALEDVPFQCPGDPCADDMGAPVADAGVPDARVVERPETPNVDADSMRADLSGDWFLSASLSGLPLRLWVALVYRESESSASIDGTLRLVTDTADMPGRAHFTADIDAEGRFEVWLPDLALEVNGLMVQGDVLLAAATIAEGWCGLAAGEVRSPVMLPLANSTFGATRWTPGPETPEDAFNACP